MATETTRPLLHAMIAVVALALPSFSAALPYAQEPPPFRADVRTTIVSLSAGGHAQVIQFVALRPLSGREFSLFIPVAGTPDSVEAQGMTQDAFDRTYVHGARLEGAFYAQARAERFANLCLFGGLGINGGIPAWLLLGAHHPLHAPALTAVLPAGALPDADLPVARSVRLLHEEEFGNKALPAPEKNALAALRGVGNGCMIVVAVQPPASQALRPEEPAGAGVCVRYRLPLSGGTLNQPLTDDSRSASPALTRLYVTTERNCTANATLPVAGSGRAWPQALVTRAIEALRLVDSARDDLSREPGGVSVSAVRASDGSRTLRWVSALQPLNGNLHVSLRRAPVGLGELARVAAGWILLGLLGPAVALLYWLGVVYAPHVYLWLTGFPEPPASRRKHILLAILGPILTPWFMLRSFATIPPVSESPDEDGALGVLSPRSYECIARLVVWALLVCLTWAIIGSAAAAALWLRFG